MKLFKVKLERYQCGRKLPWEKQDVVEALEAPEIGKSKILMTVPPIEERITAVEEIELSVDYTNSLHSIALKIIERNRKLFKKQVFIESNEKSVTERIKFVKWYVATHDAPLDELLYDLSEFYLHISYDRLIRMLKDQNVIKDVDKC
ncbi:hypothetical protein [Zunongwangia profunda]|jgi:hypothetical protein|uniref:hypothetical protein n=1 Tax=Zunongwangia profunda TaxID=398743 RepID=UPI00248DC240|nr:hypothetical protein [Zunongwangia profunda]|tara:strand:+ start:6658 stop:7098 length:441 start_codon:yes stop_codon:yes gene_type:complete